LAKGKLTLAETALFGLLGGMTFAAKLAMAALPNIEPVSLLVMLFAVTFGRKALYPIYAYVLLEFAMYGVNLWSVNYLYVWLILAVCAHLLRGMESPLGWALLSGVFGLLFGLLCAPVYAFTGGPAFAVSWWISGIPYDLLHCGGNFFMVLALFVPLRKLLGRLYSRMTVQAGAEGKTA
jgi:energy-coupling factor transport system substrate-specific component